MSITLDGFVAGANGDKVLVVLAEKSTDKNIKGMALYMMVSSEIEKTDYPRHAAAYRAWRRCGEGRHWRGRCVR